jgi:adenosylmethionine-8-amino-7-oxononanoate aminotransferase
MPMDDTRPDAQEVHPPTGDAHTAQLAAWDREFLWHPFTPMKAWCENKEIVVIERGEREFLIDTEGRRYIDGVSSLWCNVHGHCVPELDAAVREQLGKIAHSTLLGLSNVPAVRLGKKLVELARGCGLGLDRVFYSDNGSTAVEVACKMAYQFWRNGGAADGARARFLALRGAYHGDTIGAVSLGGIPLFHQAFKGLCFGVDFVPPPAWEDEGAASLAALDEMLRGQPEAYAGIVVEPLIQGAGGMMVHPPGFLREVRRIADEHGVLLIADEVMTGFGRTGRMFACEHEGVTPDLMCLSKGLTGGYMPLGVTLATRRMFEAFYVDPSLPGNMEKTFFHGHTFTGHPLACAVALASLELFEKNKVLEHVAGLMPMLGEMLEKARGMPHVKDVRQCGLMGAIDLAHEDGSPFPAAWRVGGEACTRMRGLGLMMRPLADTVVVMPPLAILRASMEDLCAGILGGLRTLPEIVRAREFPR